MDLMLLCVDNMLAADIVDIPVTICRSSCQYTIIVITDIFMYVL